MGWLRALAVPQLSATTRSRAAAIQGVVERRQPQVEEENPGTLPWARLPEKACHTAQVERVMPSNSAREMTPSPSLSRESKSPRTASDSLSSALSGPDLEERRVLEHLPAREAEVLEGGLDGRVALERAKEMVVMETTYAIARTKTAPGTLKQLAFMAPSAGRGVGSAEKGVEHNGLLARFELSILGRGFGHDGYWQLETD